jgi:hypothetical protein
MRVPRVSYEEGKPGKNIRGKSKGFCLSDWLKPADEPGAPFVADGIAGSAIWRGFVRSTGNVLGKDFDDRSTEERVVVEKVRRHRFDRSPQGEKLSQASTAFGALHSRKRVQCKIADLTLHDLLIVQH